MHEKEDKDVSIDKTVEEVFQILSRECRRIGGNISLLEFTLHPKRQFFLFPFWSTF
jgi:hypothetical protein